MTRLLALTGYFYQSAAAIILIFTVSHILPPAEYTHFSLALASSQLLCIFMFEWLQLAGVRFLAAARGDHAARLRLSLTTGALISAVILVLIGAVASTAVALPTQVVALGLALAVLQGLTDLLFTMIRVDGRLGTAGLLLIIRASILLGGAIAGALIGNSTSATLTGSICGYGVSLLAGLIALRSPLRRASLQDVRSDLSAFCRYGMLAAGASVIHLTVPVTIRFLVVGHLAPDPAASAGFSMAIDLLQRPFSVLVSAIHTINYPEVVFKFEHEPEQEARRATARLFNFVVCTTLVLLGGLIGFLPDAGRLFVPPAILHGFLETAPAAAIFYFLHTHLQATLAVVPHLRKSALRLVAVAGCQLAAASAITVVALSRDATPATVLASASGATALIMVLASGPTLRFGAVPRVTLVLAATLAALIIGSFCLLNSQPLPWLLAKMSVAAIATALLAWQGDFLEMAQPASRRHARS
jgi:O-antigen/teichoic acid export membrane protein